MYIPYNYDETDYVWPLSICLFLNNLYKSLCQDGTVIPSDHPLGVPEDLYQLPEITGKIIVIVQIYNRCTDYYIITYNRDKVIQTTS